PLLYALSLHDALPICLRFGFGDHAFGDAALQGVLEVVDVEARLERLDQLRLDGFGGEYLLEGDFHAADRVLRVAVDERAAGETVDRKSTRLNSSHVKI